jgi:two-component system, OmpR family, response regulator
MNPRKSLFFVEDDLSFGAVLKSYLEICNFSVTWMDDGKYAFSAFREGTFDLCLLDVMLPHVDGFSIGREIRSVNPSIPIIYLTAKSLKEDIITGYRIGADDYIIKPFDTDVLLYKIAVVLKRSEKTLNTEDLQVQIGQYIFDPKLREINYQGVKQLLSPKEAALLKLLCEHKNELLSREIALKRIWGDDGYFTTRSMDVFVTRLRKYLKDDPSIEIRNIHGSGFILTSREESE